MLDWSFGETTSSSVSRSLAQIQDEKHPRRPPRCKGTTSIEMGNRIEDEYREAV
jgi:hypothetical protein